MTVIMTLSLTYASGKDIEQELVYEGDTPEDVARDVARDENALMEYMRTENDHGEMCFCFCGFMFRKAGLLTAKMQEGFGI